MHLENNERGKSMQLKYRHDFFKMVVESIKYRELAGLLFLIFMNFAF